ncbi:CU044_5270 family protein [Amycolatopsis sp. NBC_01488]|uniref:CU044_5270 family protein n=1 Tax=Amycolatopsis sp. NBC_01488 TaxID=2903563 RepID=UPI002E2C99E2|nr:CU044_5270 family protein [Amycolatopsis sp. NBC_01488]
MNDLEALRAALIPDEPAQDVVDRSRHRLQNRMLGAPPKRFRPLVLGAGLAAAAVAAGVVVATLPGAPAPAAPPQAVAPVDTGQQVLLAAATVAAKAPAESGTYWHVKISAGKSGLEYWTAAADGHQWYRGAKSGDQLESVGLQPFRLVALEVTLDQIRALPTEPTALRDWIVNALKRSDAKVSMHPLMPKDREQALLQSLISLVSTVPAAPDVRAAAFRAIAAYPGVRALGAVSGGQALLLPLGERLVVDPATGRVNATSTYVPPNGGLVHVADPQGAAITAEWTDKLPK